MRVGVIGLGRRWRRRYKPALSALSDLFTIGSVCDEIQGRAAAEARSLGCLVQGPAALIQRADIDAIVMSDSQWFGLWPVELACTAGKPVFSAVPLEADRTHVGQIVERVRAAALPFMLETVPRAAPELARLQAIVEAELGAPRLARVEVTRPPLMRAPLSAAASESLVPFVDWTTRVFHSEPVGATCATAGSMRLWTLDFGGGKAAEIVQREAAGACQNRFEVVAAHGRITVELPGLLTWNVRDGRQVQLLRRRAPVGRQLLTDFHRVVTADAAPEPGLADAYRMLRWLYPE